MFNTMLYLTLTIPFLMGTSEVETLKKKKKKKKPVTSVC